MVVSELIEKLKTIPGDLEVIIDKSGSSDEGSPLYFVDDEYIYVKENAWSGELVHANHSSADMCMSLEEWNDFKAKHKRCCLLMPTN